MKLKSRLALILVFVAICVRMNVVVAQQPIHDRDDYGAIRWRDERFRLDNFAIQLKNDNTLVGYILILAEAGGCPGEAQARAIRAKRYLVEHHGVPWNSVVWRVEGHGAAVSTILEPISRDKTVPYPFRSSSTGKDGPLTQNCKKTLREIARSLPPSQSRAR